jgi:phosphate transport system substrate-binding protein
MSRKLNDNERAFFKEKNRIPKETLIAYDGVAFICNKKNTDTTLSYNEIKNLFSGKTKTWKELGTLTNDSVLLVFESHKSGNARFIKEYFKLNALPANCFAVDDNAQVIKYVEEHPTAIGILSSGLIADMDDSLSQQFLNRVRVMGVSAADDPEGLKGFIQPYQEYIGDGTYPFKREIYIVNCEIGTRLGTGFASFIASDKGQRIILKSGLLPAVTPVRFIEVSNEF